MGNLYLIPTQNPSELYKNLDGELGYTKGYSIQNEGFNDNQNIYITSDEEIKEGDWCIDNRNTLNKIINVSTNGYLMFENGNSVKTINCKKIILTTDPDLIKNGVQAIPDESFLEWFVKNPSCEQVEVVSELKAFDKNGFCVSMAVLDTDYTKLVYYIVPKKEPNIIDDWLEKNGNPEIAKQVELEAKELFEQQTLKEVAKDFVENTMKYSLTSMDTKTVANRLLKCVEFGAKWQQEQENNEAIEFGKWLGSNTQRREYYPMVGMSMKELFDVFKNR